MRLEKVPAGGIRLAQQHDGEQALHRQLFVQHFADGLCFQPPVAGTVVGRFHMVEKVHDAVRRCVELDKPDQIVEVQCHVGELLIALFAGVAEKLKRQQVLAVVDGGADDVRSAC